MMPPIPLSLQAPRVGLYARVSSEQQVQSGTIDSQLAALRDKLSHDGLSVEPEMRFVDDGFSGATLVRPALERLRDLAAAGGIDRLYVLCPDRLARSYAYQMLLVDELHSCGVELVFVNHDLGKTPEDHLLLQVQGMVSEYERAKIMERSRRGKMHAARQGSVSVLSTAPYGYRYLSRWAGGGAACINIHLQEAAVVRQIFQWVGLDRLSLGEVCRRLKTQAIPSPKGRAVWNRTTVWGLLQNPAFKGQAAFGKTRCGPMRPRLRALRHKPEQPRRPHSAYRVPTTEWIPIPVPALVDEELFEAVAAQLQENRQRFRQRRRGARYLLQGLLVCGCCQYACHGQTARSAGGKGPPRNYGYYRCAGTDPSRFGGQRLCANRPLRQDQLDELVWNDVSALLSDPQRIARELERRRHADSQEPVRQHQEKLRASIASVQRGMARLIDAYGDGLLDKAQFAPRITAAKEQLSRLHSALQSQVDQEAQTRELRLVIDQLEVFAQRIATGLHNADWSMRRDVIRSLVKRVEITPEQIKVVYRIDLHPHDTHPERRPLQHCCRRRCVVA